MKKISMIFVALLATAPAFSATPEELDKLLQGIDLDIEALRLSSPPGNNALEKINEFRGEAPFDFRVVRLAYSWGEAYISLSKEARANGDYTKAQGYLDKVWKVAALTKGLEDEQRAVDEALSNSGQAKPAVTAAVAPNAAEIERQRKLADAAAKEKQRLKVEAEKRRQIVKQPLNANVVRKWSVNVAQHWLPLKRQNKKRLKRLEQRLNLLNAHRL
jgi:colicin import membrane protein